MHGWSKTVMHRTPVELHELIGVHYRQQQIGPILTEAEQKPVVRQPHGSEGDVDDQPREISLNSLVRMVCVLHLWSASVQSIASASIFNS